MHRNTKFVKSQEKILTSFMDGITPYAKKCTKKRQKEVFMLFLDGSIIDMLDIFKSSFFGVWSSIEISTTKRGFFNPFLYCTEILAV